MRTLFAILATLALASAAHSLEYQGITSIDTVEAHPGDHFGVKVWLRSNNADFSALFFPLRYHSSLLSLDSVSFAGSMKPVDFSGMYYDFTGLQLAQITYLPPITGSLPLPSITDNEGIIAELFFTLSEQATPGFIPIDSAIIDTPTWTGIVLSDNTGDSLYFPDCIPGGVQVLTPTGVSDGFGDGVLPTEFALSQNYPNPFNPRTVVGYSLPYAGSVRLEVFNVLGQSVAVLVDGVMPAGYHQAEYAAEGLPSGIYFYRLTHPAGAETKKMILLK
jgi:hypothetical protein